MKEILERLTNILTRGDLTKKEMNEFLKISLSLTSEALELNARSIMNKQDRVEMVIMTLSLLTSHIFEALDIEQSNIIINPSDPEYTVSEDVGYAHLRGNCWQDFKKETAHVRLVRQNIATASSSVFEGETVYNLKALRTDKPRIQVHLSVTSSSPRCNFLSHIS